MCVYVCVCVCVCVGEMGPGGHGVTTLRATTRQGLIFVVDSNDRERAVEAKDELNKMVGWAAQQRPGTRSA